MNESLELAWVHFQKVQKKNLRYWLQNLRANKLVQSTVLAASLSVILSALFVILANLIGAFLSSMIVLFVLDKVLGMKIQPQAFSRAF
jgi:hypothetical protein